ncbi:unnamed protein product [Angiostrongylus costaricensis]|uniref:DUF4283 domain-containing protein n=1 Tax=Angiostrongylus costaricensis TaxID=334426 RepID=A0A0R3PAC0_ANGCS|nr:unnamed protein product [Angiostrongylus costaricensis]
MTSSDTVIGQYVLRLVEIWKGVCGIRTGDGSQFKIQSQLLLVGLWTDTVNKGKGLKCYSKLEVMLFE